MNRISLSLVLCLSTAGNLWAERLEVKEEEPTPIAEKAGGRAEVGAVAGWPVGVGMAVGYWGDPTRFPVVARLTTGLGTTVEVGWGFKNERNLRAFVGVGAGAIGYLNLFRQTEYYLGPVVGLRIGDLSVGMGPAARMRANQPTYISFMGSVGATGLF